ncbi:MAG: CsbD family protein [Microthrixaceae bacterium]
MSGTTDDLKGRVQEATGDLTGDKDLQREGKVDQAVGAVKDKAEDAKDWVENTIDKAKDKLHK